MKLETALSENNIPLKLHTWVNENYRISSIYRQSSSIYNPSWYWETMVFAVLDTVDTLGNKEQRIVEQEESCSINEAAELHITFYNKYVTEGKVKP